MKIKIDELETITKKLFQHLRNQKILEFDIEEDFYWNIDKNERYNPYKKPLNLDLGQLEDDWSELVNIINSNSETISYAFVWLSNILRIIGEKKVR
jgi:hypothetical protein